EVGIAHLRRHCARALTTALEVAGHTEGHSAEFGMERLEIDDVAFERLLLADRDAFDGELERPRVDAAGAVAQHRPDLAREQAPELGVVERGELTDGRDAGAREADLGLRPDAGQFADGEGRKVRGLAARWHDSETARLASVARHLGHDLAGRDAERASQSSR